MVLTDTAIKQAKPASKPYTLTDGDGLSLQVPTTGSKLWHFRFYWHDKQLRISLGSIPTSVLRRLASGESLHVRWRPTISIPAHIVAPSAKKPLTPPTTRLKRLLDAGVSSEVKS